jgi:DNA-binding LacI/PurR family transcriptional regulator
MGDDLAPWKRAKLVDVAKRAGVTKSVVSRCLNGDPTLSIRPQTRARIHAAASALGYQPHAGARALAYSRPKAIALLVPDLMNPIYSRIIRGACHRADTLGYVLLLAEDLEGEKEADDSFAHLVSSGRVDGLIIASARPRHRLIESPALATVPHVFVNRSVPGSNRNVVLDFAESSRVAVSYLAGLGHRQIGMISGPLGLPTSTVREEAALMTARELRIDEPFIDRSDFSGTGGAEAARRLLHDHPEVTAVYISSFEQSVGAMHSAREAGRRIPSDLSILAYDDLPQSAFTEPPLTTMSMPLVEMGEASVDELVSQIEGDDPRDRTITTSPQVIERSSTARCCTADRR